MDKRITIIGGAYGSGKTELSIAYALNKLNEGLKVGMADLDIVNPYFRSRDQTQELSEKGITLVSSQPGLENADIPALSPRIIAVLQNPEFEKVIFDVGGDPAGARALGRFNPYFKKESYDFWMVINPYRPDTRNLEEIMEMISKLQTASRLQITGIVSNINLGPETNLEIWRQGLKLIEKITDRLRLPLVSHMVAKDFSTLNKNFLTKYPLFEVDLQMRLPWLKQ